MIYDMIYDMIYYLIYDMIYDVTYYMARTGSNGSRQQRDQTTPGVQTHRLGKISSGNAHWKQREATGSNGKTFNND